MYIREQLFERRQLPPVPVLVQPQSASAPKPPVPQYNPVGVNTTAITYQGGCGGCGKVPR